MDLATIAGLLLGGFIILTTLLAGGVPVQTLFQPEALLIVVGGTFTAVLIQFSFARIIEAINAIPKVFRDETIAPAEVVTYLCDAANYIRLKGLLAVQPLLQEIPLPFLREGLQMVIDNQPTEHIRAQLTTKLEVAFQNQLSLARVFESAGGFSPTMGIIGAVIGLIQVMTLFKTPDQLSHGVGTAFVATLYGVGLSNLILLPIAGKLKQRAKDEWFLQAIMLQGIIALRDGENPVLIREKLGAFLHTEEPEAVEEDFVPELSTRRPNRAAQEAIEADDSLEFLNR